MWETETITERALKIRKHWLKPLINGDAFELFSRNTTFRILDGKFVRVYPNRDLSLFSPVPKRRLPDTTIG